MKDEAEFSRDATGPKRKKKRKKEFQSFRDPENAAFLLGDIF